MRGSGSVIQATRYKVKAGMKLSLTRQENGQLILQNDDETEKLDIGIQKKYYLKDHEANHKGCEELRNKILELKYIKVGPEGLVLEFNDQNKSGNSRAQMYPNNRRGNPIGNENSANQNQIETTPWW